MLFIHIYFNLNSVSSEQQNYAYVLNRSKSNFRLFAPHKLPFLDHFYNFYRLILNERQPFSANHLKYFVNKHHLNVYVCSGRSQATLVNRL